MTFNDDFILSSSRNFIEHHFDEMVFLIISQINFFVLQLYDTLKKAAGVLCDREQLDYYRDIACYLIRKKGYTDYIELEQQVKFLFDIPGEWRPKITFDPNETPYMVFVPKMYGSYRQAFFIQALKEECKMAPFVDWLHKFK